MPDSKPEAPTFEKATLRIQPPAYTRLPITNSTNLNAVSVVGSGLTWQVQFSSTQNLTVKLVGSRGQALSFKNTGDGFTHQDRLINSGLYAIKAYWRTENNRDSLIYQSDFYRLEAKPDLAPKIEPTSKELYTYHYLKDPKTLSVSATISDDFSVSQAYIVATVARGSGENVKFREMKFPLGQANFKEARLTKTLDLKALQFAPGDELYYYWAAFDNRQPEPNFTKSDSYFVVYKDTTQLEESELATMAVNIMPEYFRSQRQIIIDTEKLIAGKEKDGGLRHLKVSRTRLGSTRKHYGYVTVSFWVRSSRSPSVAVVARLTVMLRRDLQPLLMPTHTSTTRAKATMERPRSTKRNTVTATAEGRMPTTRKTP